MKSNRQPVRTTLDRREFVRAVAFGPPVGMALPSALAIGKDEVRARSTWTMKLSTSSIHFRHLPVEQACEKIAKLGFEAVDIWSAHQGCPHLDDVLERLGPEGLKEVLGRLKLELSAFSVYQGGYRRYAELLGKVGGGVAVRDSTRPCQPSELTARMRAFLEGLRPEIELAEKYNSYLAIENHGHALLDSVDSFKAFTDLNQSPRLGIALAPYHLQANGASVEEAISVSGRQLFFFYAWQRAKGVEQLPGHGPTDFTPWIGALEKIRYGKYVNPFTHGDIKSDAMFTALARSKSYLTKCYAKASGK